MSKNTFKKTIEITKKAYRTLNDENIHRQITYVIERMLAAGRGSKWQVDMDAVKYSYDSNGNEHTYLIPLQVTAKKYTPGVTDDEFNKLVDITRKAANKERWDITKLDGEEIAEDFTFERPEVEIKLPNNWKNHFSHIFDRQNQIDIVMSSIMAGVNSNFKKRFHSVLHGPPACGKTEIVGAFKQLLGPDAVLEYDATSTTQAGAIRDLSNREVMPRVLMVEELEKADENSLRWLLSILDMRGEIRKVTAREQIQKNVKLLCIATVNDYELFNKMMYGALASRFPNKIYCPRPDEKILRKILTREINDVGGNLAWVDPAVKYATEEKINDPRIVTAIALQGGDDLLNGKYQKKLQSCKVPEV